MRLFTFQTVDFSPESLVSVLRVEPDGFFNLEHFTMAIKALDLNIVVLLGITGEGGRCGCAVLVAQELAVLLLLDVTVEILHEQVLTQLLVTSGGILTGIDRVIGQQTAPCGCRQSSVNNGHKPG